MKLQMQKKSLFFIVARPKVDGELINSNFKSCVSLLPSARRATAHA